jgi:hypothetical protein
MAIVPNENYNGKTKLKDWWKIVRDNFKAIFAAHNTHRDAAELDHPDGSVRAKHIADGAVGTTQLAKGAVNNVRIANNAVDARVIQDEAVTALKIKNDEIGDEKLQYITVVDEITDNGPGGVPGIGQRRGKPLSLLISLYRKMAEHISGFAGHRAGIPLDHPNESVTTEKIAAGAVGTAQLAVGAVNHFILADSAVETKAIKNNAVTTEKLASGAVNSSALANNAVETRAIKDGAVNAQKLEQTLALTIDSKAEGVEHYPGDLNDCRTIGIYYVTGSNLPPNETQGYMTVYHSIDDTMQLIYCFDGSADNIFRCYTRTGYIPDDPQQGRQWTDWRAIDTHASRTDNPHSVTKSQLGLGNVDNTSDMNKPISTAVQTALNGKVDKISGKGLSTNDYTNEDKSKLASIQVNDGIVVTGVSSVAGKTGAVTLTKADVGLANVDNTSDANKPISTAVQSELNKRPEASIKKNPDSLSGDIISTHFTVGSRKSGKAYGSNSATFGYGNTASGSYSKAAGLFSEATGFYASAEGYYSTATGDTAHAEGKKTSANGKNAHAEGEETEAVGNVSYAGGYQTRAGGDYSHTEGVGAYASSYAEHAQGVYNKLSATSATAYNSTANAMIIGNGTNDTTRSNAFRVTFNGNVYGLATFHSTGADYAEYFEWADSNPEGEERVGRFVAIDGEKIHVAGKNDTNILGIVSANPAVLGNAHEDTYHSMYLSDEWGRVQYEYVDVPAEYEERVVGADGKGNEVTEQVEVRPAHTDYVPKLNPDYNPDEEYIPRSERNEWDAIGMMGQLLVRDDGTCVPGGTCTWTDDGAATASETGYYVMSRVSDNIIKILFR